MPGRLKCPACQGAIAVNPFGRWFSRFKCPHCGERLRFDRTTNMLGLLAGLAFVASGFSLAFRGAAIMEERSFQIGVGAWVVMLAMSYALRGVERDA
jgi:hypothetical protein